MKSRRHHNNTGYRQIQNGRTAEQVERIASRVRNGQPRETSVAYLRPCPYCNVQMISEYQDRCESTGCTPSSVLWMTWGPDGIRLDRRDWR